MELENIIVIMAEQPTLYGEFARKLKGNEELSLVFLQECYDSILKHPNYMKDCFGESLMQNIINYFKEE